MQVVRKMQLFSCIGDLLVIGRGGHCAASDKNGPGSRGLVDYPKKTNEYILTTACTGLLM